MKRDEYLIGIHDLPAILEAATKPSNMASSHVIDKSWPAHPYWSILSVAAFFRFSIFKIDYFSFESPSLISS